MIKGDVAYFNKKAIYYIQVGYHVENEIDYPFDRNPQNRYAKVKYVYESVQDFLKQLNEDEDYKKYNNGSNVRVITEQEPYVYWMDIKNENI